MHPVQRLPQVHGRGEDHIGIAHDMHEQGFREHLLEHLDAAGVRDAVGKILGTKNKISNVYATIEALKTIAMIEERKRPNG